MIPSHKWQTAPYRWVLTMADLVSKNEDVEIDDVLGSWVLDGCMSNSLLRGLQIFEEDARVGYFQAAHYLQTWAMTGKATDGDYEDDIPF